MKHDNTHNVVGAVHNKSRTDRQSHIDRKERRRQDATTLLKTDWSKELAISARCHAWKKSLNDLLTQIQSMCDGHIGHISVARHRLELLQPDTKPVLSVPCRKALKLGDLRKPILIKKNILAVNIINPAPAECTVPIVFVPNMNESLRFCTDHSKLNAVTNKNRIPHPVWINLFTREAKLPSSRR